MLGVLAGGNQAGLVAAAACMTCMWRCNTHGQSMTGTSFLTPAAAADAAAAAADAANAPAAADVANAVADVDACMDSPCGKNMDCIDLPKPAGAGPDGRECRCVPGATFVSDLLGCFGKSDKHCAGLGMGDECH